jgi:acetyl-CoA acyltransferase
MVKRWGFSREQVDQFAAQSHARAAAAIDDGVFEDHIVPIAVDGTKFSVDEGLRRGTSVETLAGLKPAFDPEGVVHAGNSSQISDGAAALLITTSEKAAELGLTQIARYHSGAVSGADPIMMLTGPIPATEKVLRRAGLTIDDIGVFEVNEAFATVPMAWLAETGADPERLNPLGGAIAVGHPLGASGAILMTRMLARMRRQNLRYGLQTMCEGGGTANATIIELLT